MRYNQEAGEDIEDITYSEWKEQKPLRLLYGNDLSIIKKVEDNRFQISNSASQNGLPRQGISNGIVDKTDDSGKVLQRRLYDETGKAKIDFDTNDHGMPSQHPTYAHKHIFNHSKKNPHGQPLE